MLQALIFVQAFLFLFLTKFCNFFYDFHDRTVFYGTIWPSYVQKYHILKRFAWFLKPVGDGKWRSRRPNPREYCIFVLISFTLQDTGKISSTVGLDAKLDPQRRPGDLISCYLVAPPGTSFFTCQNLCYFDASCAMLDPFWNTPGDLSEPSCSPPGGLLGAFWGPLKIFLKFHRVLTTTYQSKNVGSFTSWPSCPHLLYFLLCALVLKYLHACHNSEGPP